MLLRAYKQEKGTVLQVLLTLLVADNIEIEHRDAVWKALRDYEAGEIATFHPEACNPFRKPLDTPPAFRVPKRTVLWLDVHR